MLAAGVGAGLPGLALMVTSVSADCDLPYEGYQRLSGRERSNLRGTASAPRGSPPVSSACVAPPATGRPRCGRRSAIPSPRGRHAPRRGGSRRPRISNPVATGTHTPPGRAANRAWLRGSPTVDTTATAGRGLAFEGSPEGHPRLGALTRRSVEPTHSRCLESSRHDAWSSPGSVDTLI